MENVRRLRFLRHHRSGCHGKRSRLSDDDRRRRRRRHEDSVVMVVMDDDGCSGEETVID